MVVGLLKIEIFMDGNMSLKEKRRIVKGLIHRVRSKFDNVSASEVGFHDLWQRSAIGISFVSNDKPIVNSMLDRITDFIASTGLVQIVGRDIEILHFKQ
ncbi:MAG: DUF503 domain-containing protein [Deltaproteobacteria bacterium]